MLRDPCSEIPESVEDMAVSGDQFALAVLDIRKRSEAINLQFLDELIRIKRFGAT
jgi:hypothetical protein